MYALRKVKAPGGSRTYTESVIKVLIIYMDEIDKNGARSIPLKLKEVYNSPPEDLKKSGENSVDLYCLPECDGKPTKELSRILCKLDKNQRFSSVCFK